MTGLLGGLAAAFHWTNLWPAVIGCFLGTAVGVLPGMAPTAAIGLLLPVAMILHPLPGIIFLAGIYYGTQYGSSISAILINVPSEPPSVVLARDGYQLTRRGRGGAAIGVAALASFCGGIVGLLGLSVVAPFVSHLAVQFGPAEFFAISIFGLFALSRLTSGSLGLALVAVGIGLALSTIGIDPISDVPRFTFGILAIQQGVSVVPVAVGFFGITELIYRAYARAKDAQRTGRIPMRELIPQRKEMRKALPAIARGSVLGFIFGSVPGPALVLASFGSYRIERALRRGRAENEDLMAGVAGPKAADDAAVGGTLGPLMALGLPFTPVTAVLFAGFVLKGLQPGPTFITLHATEFWTLIGAMILGNVVLLLLNMPGVNLWVNLLRIRASFLSAIMVAVMVVGVYALSNSWFDVMLMAASGLFGVVLDRLGIDKAVVILGLVLGPTAEESLRQVLMSNGGHLGSLLRSPTSAGILIATLAAVVIPALLEGRSRHQTRSPVG